MRHISFSLLTVCGLMVSGCASHTMIQQRYVEQRDVCRQSAELKYSAYTPVGEQRAADPRDRNAQLATLFSDCMFQRGWTVATPPREKPPEVADTAGNPWQPTPYGVTAAGRAAPAQQAPAQPTAQPQSYNQPVTPVPYGSTSADTAGNPWQPSPYARPYPQGVTATPAAPAASSAPAQAKAVVVTPPVQKKQEKKDNPYVRQGISNAPYNTYQPKAKP